MAQGVLMVHDHTPAESEYTFDVQLRQLPDESLWSRYPAASVHTTEPTTALRRESRPDQLDELLQRVQSVGLVLVDVRRITPVPGEAPGQDVVHEVRVKGVLGAALLTYLRWPHYVVPAETWVRIAAASADLLVFLQRCTAAGASIERVRVVAGAQTRAQTEHRVPA